MIGWSSRGYREYHVTRRHSTESARIFVPRLVALLGARARRYVIRDAGALRKYPAVAAAAHALIDRDGQDWTALGFECDRLGPGHRFPDMLGRLAAGHDDGVGDERAEAEDHCSYQPSPWSGQAA